ncbi:TonB-dependent receptor [Kordiimonas lipolytica]|uniref:TonB-dependent receptor n=1 Tax=Kordiimonas lipolytica TaxID=1662421 RepID=A0ABV8U8V2_9PROT|nr:TonB-dependent receptor [Kordiimonas lipolytica]
MKKTWFNHSACLIAGCSALALSVGANAQSASDGFALEEIVVTAQKREQSLQDVPISISALSGDKINTFAAGGEDIRLLSSRVPGLNAESSNGRVAPRFYIRGLGNTDFDLAASQPVSVVVDEVVQENVILKSFPLFDVERVEVLRGPQGTLFGRNTPAGIIKFDTRKPTQEAEGYLSASYGSYGTGSVEFAQGGGISDKLSARVSMLYSRRDDHIDNAYLDEDDALGGFEEFAGRLQLMFEPTDTFSALTNVHFRSLSGTSSLFRANILTTGSNDLNGNFDRDTVYFGDDHGNPQEYDSWGASLKMVKDFNNEMTLTSITAYETTNGSSLGDIDGGNPDGPGFIPFQSTTQDHIDDLDQITQELRLSQQASDQLFYQVGFFFFDSDFTVRTSPFFVPDSTVRHQNTAWALFGQVSYDIQPETTLTIGMRYTDDEKTADAYSGAFGAQLDTVELEGDRVSWDAAINHAVNDDLSVYARVASGFRAPTIQGRDVAFFGVPTTAKEETIMSYEAGFKATLAENRLRWNGAVFYYDVSDLQVTAVGGATNSVQLVSVDEVIGYGFETDIEWLASENLTITAGLGYANTQINDTGLRVPTCGSGQCTPIDPLDDDGYAIVDGNPLPQAPDWTVNFTADYHREMGDGEFFTFVDFALQGDTNMLLYDAEEFSTSGTFELGARMGYRFGEALQHEVSIFGRNITNEANLKGVIDFNNNTGFVNAPRVFGIGLSTRW